MKIFKFILLFFCFLTKNKIVFSKNIKLIPNTKDYEDFFEKKNMNETRLSQKSWILSAIFPTMGQIYNKKYLRASLFGAGFLSLIGGALYCQNYYCKYTNENIYSSANTYSKVRDGFLLAAFVLYVINIFDAYVISKTKDFEISDNVDVKIVSTKDSMLEFGLNFKNF